MCRVLGADLDRSDSDVLLNLWRRCPGSPLASDQSASGHQDVWSRPGYPIKRHRPCSSNSLRLDVRCFDHRPPIGLIFPARASESEFDALSQPRWVCSPKGASPSTGAASDGSCKSAVSSWLRYRATLASSCARRPLDGNERSRLAGRGRYQEPSNRHARGDECGLGSLTTCERRQRSEGQAPA
jgi:hypothetical protein